MKIRLLLTLILIPFYLFSKEPTFTFNNLDNLKKYAATMDEYPDIDNAPNWLRPNYSSWYKQNQQGWWSWLLTSLGLKPRSLFNVKEFMSLTTKVVKKRENNGQMGRFVEKFSPPQGTVFDIFTDLYGAFHSLVRSLEYLHAKNIIDTNLRLIKPQYYLVFNGNVIDHSPFLLETLTVVMHLMNNNPNSVFYLRGPHEDKEYWHNSGLRTELEIRAAHLSSEEIPLNSLVKRFFGTLPLALYLTHDTKDGIKVVRISSFDRDFPDLDEESFSAFFTPEQTEKPELLNLDYKKIGKTPPDIRAIIKAENRKTSYVSFRGLRYIESDKGSTAWVALSSPIHTNRTLYEFFYDAFVELTIPNGIDTWRIALFNQDVREQLGIRKTKEYYLVSTQEIIPESAIVKSVEEKKQVEEKKVVTQAEPIAVKKDGPKTTTSSASAIQVTEQQKTLAAIDEVKKITEHVIK